MEAIRIETTVAKDGILSIPELREGEQVEVIVYDSEASFERYTSGEITQEELQATYKLLLRWTIDVETLLKLLHQ